MLVFSEPFKWFRKKANRKDLVRYDDNPCWTSKLLWKGLVFFTDNATRFAHSIEHLLHSFDGVGSVFLLELEYTLADISTVCFDALQNALVNLRQLVFCLPLPRVFVASPLLFGNHVREKALRERDNLRVIRGNITWAVQMFSNQWLQLELQILEIFMVFQQIVSRLHCAFEWWDKNVVNFYAA